MIKWVRRQRGRGKSFVKIKSYQVICVMLLTIGIYGISNFATIPKGTLAEEAGTYPSFATNNYLVKGTYSYAKEEISPTSISFQNSNQRYPAEYSCTVCHKSYPAAHTLNNCAGCHGNNQPIKNCSSCHPDWQVHKEGTILSSFKCEYCHNTGYSYKIPLHPADLEAVHTTTTDFTDCQSCHAKILITEHANHLNPVTGKAYDCLTCHDNPYNLLAISNKETNCDACHVLYPIGEVNFDHPRICG